MVESMLLMWLALRVLDKETGAKVKRGPVSLKSGDKMIMRPDDPKRCQ